MEIFCFMCRYKLGGCAPTTPNYQVVEKERALKAYNNIHNNSSSCDVKIMEKEE